MSKSKASTADDPIEIRGARQHNLQNVDLTIPRNRLVVFTGVSGSGKSSLAFDTVFAEGQRRYIESLSSYARQFLGQLPKPDCDYLGGLSPSISIEQKSAGGNPRSTIGTVTEIHDYLRVLYARVGKSHCPKCDRLIKAQSREEMIRRILAMKSSTKKEFVSLMAPVVRQKKGEFKDFFADMIRKGFVRARVDGEIVRLSDEINLQKNKRHEIEIVLDRVELESSQRNRIAEAVEQSMKLSDGLLLAVPQLENLPEQLFSSFFACTSCNIQFNPLEPRSFSFNSPKGMCLECEGLGETHSFDPKLLIPDSGLSIREGAILLIGPLKKVGRWRRHIYEGVAEHVDFSLDNPWEDLAESAQEAFLYGLGDEHITFCWRSRRKVMYHGGVWEGIVNQFLSKYKKSSSPMHRRMYQKYIRIVKCPKCQGERLNPQARGVRFAGRTLIDLESSSIENLQQWFEHKIEDDLAATDWQIARDAIHEIRARLTFLMDVGLGYLSLDRKANTLSGGEAQRIRLAGQVGSGLVGVLYILDEPSIGLHHRDNKKLLKTLQRLRDQGNTVIVVEHDEETMMAADYLVDFGPGPGHRGGEIVAHGDPEKVRKSKKSVTAQYLRGEKQIEIPKRRRPVDPTTAPKIVDGKIVSEKKTVSSTATAAASTSTSLAKKKVKKITKSVTTSAKKTKPKTTRARKKTTRKKAVKTAAVKKTAKKKTSPTKAAVKSAVKKKAKKKTATK